MVAEGVLGVEGAGWEWKGNDGKRKRQRVISEEPCLLRFHSLEFSLRAAGTKRKTEAEERSELICI